MKPEEMQEKASKVSSQLDDSLGECPIARISYRGDCPVTSCVANLACISAGGMKQGCFFKCAPTPSIAAVAEALGEDEEQLSRRYDVAMSTVNHVAGLLEIAKTECPSCKYCGFPLEDEDIPYEECYDEDKCDLHTDLIDLCVNKTPYSIRELGFTKEGIWRIALTKPHAGSIPAKMKEYVRSLRDDEGYVLPSQLKKHIGRN